MSRLLNDVRLGARLLRRAPGFTAAAVSALALGIGATSVVFSVAYTVLLKPLPYPAPERLVSIAHLYNKGRAPLSPTNFLDFQASAQSLASSAMFNRIELTLTGQGEPIILAGAAVSPGFFDVLRVAPRLGRALTAEDGEPGRSKVALLGDELWRTRFGADAAVVGRTIQLDREPYTVVGVLPAGFSMPAGRAVWVPIEMTPRFRQARGAWYLSGIGRLKPGVTEAAAASEAETIGRRLAKDFPNDNEGVGLSVIPLQTALVGNTRGAIGVLLGAVALLLLISCANVAHLALARATRRGGEMAVRAALGAGAAGLFRQLLVEHLVLAGLGGALGLALAGGGIALLRAFQPGVIPRFDEIALHGPVVGFTAAVTLLTGDLFGCVPALRARRTELTDALREGARPTTPAGAGVRGALVVAEMALAVLLLVGAGLLMRSFVKLRGVDPGFHADNVLAFELQTPMSVYAAPASRGDFYARTLERLTALPGVQQAAAASALPLTGNSFGFSFKILGRPAPPPALEPSIQTRIATPDYFKVMGIPLKRGRLLAAGDVEGAPPVLVVSESTARRFFPSQDALGHRLELGWRAYGPNRIVGEIVGVVGDIKEVGLDAEVRDTAYFPHAQVPAPNMTVVLRATAPPLSLAQAAARSVHELDPSLPVNRVRTLDAVIDGSVARPRFYALLLTLFASLALFLTAVGIVGVTSYSVAQRAREMGIRMALGATGGDVVRLVVSGALRTAGAGVGLGLCSALALTGTLRTLLFQVQPTDPATLAGVAAGLLAVAVLAALAPAWHAARADPALVLRAE